MANPNSLTAKLSACSAAALRSPEDAARLAELLGALEQQPTGMRVAEHVSGDKTAMEWSMGAGIEMADVDRRNLEAWPPDQIQAALKALRTLAERRAQGEDAEVSFSRAIADGPQLQITLRTSLEITVMGPPGSTSS